ncbi:hypothetical protein DEJ50_29190 [Streptomyces venezuelae]|uniref:Integral-membrane protein n=1 Tax=Streptomyces venezuelae TaxID=54571 RepID=A0A5P2DE09_STRVZ|nr:hypothetical protein [Streptomyces venezuelae]QES51309.1 hypothetical protein DEJ50_29190 [Streptomyces venezuelae]
MFAAVCVLLAALGHVLMSGAPVAGWTIAAGFAGTAAAAWLLAARERGLLVVTSAAVAAQALLHSAFSLGLPSGHQPSPGSCAPPAAGSAAPAHHLHAGHAGQIGQAATDGAVPAGHDMACMSPTGMTAAHLLAALLCGLWLAYGEQALFRLLRSFTGRFLTPLWLLLRRPVPLHPQPPRLRVRRERRARPLRRLLLDHAITSRGPPPGTAVR